MSNKKKLFLNLFMFLFYFIYQFISLIGIGLFKINVQSNFTKELYLFISSFIYLIIVLIVYLKELRQDFKEFNIKILIKYIPIYIIGIILMALSNYLMASITHSEISQNENAIRESLKIFPIYMSFSVVIYAPFVEEITFRKTFKNIINNGVLFVILSGFIFGLVHVSLTSEPINDLLMIVPYIIMGINFSYIYYKSNNIFTTISIHFIHNLLLLILQFIGG